MQSIMPNQQIINKVIAQLRFGDNGLLPAIAQDASSRDVLMLAWMNEQAVRLTLETGRGTYWSRSRGSIWVKGESSGHTQHVREFYYDCDGDTILLIVDQHGAACHTNRPTCFFYKVDDSGVHITQEPIAP